jgi:hypothetical protein
MPVTYKKIASVTVTAAGGSADIDFQNIPADYTDIVFHYSLRAVDNIDFGRIEINGSASNFSSRRLTANGSTPSSSSRTDNYLIGFYNPSGATASTFSNTTFYFPNYTASANKSFSADSVTENNGTTAQQVLFAGLWSNTAAITRIRIVPETGNFAQYSTATLYGISKS